MDLSASLRMVQVPSNNPLHMKKLLNASLLLATLCSPSLALQGNDSCTTPEAIVGTGTFNFDCTTATTGSAGQGEGLCYAFASTAVDQDVWFEWTPDFSGMVIITTCGGSTDDTKIAAYPGSGCPSFGAAVACNEDDCGYQSTIEFGVIDGSTYMLQIGNFPGSIPTTAGTFTITEDAPDYLPETGHYYDWIATGPIDWASAKTAAESLYYQGVQGHLVSITSQEENDFIQTTFGQRAWVGAYQDHNDPSYSEPSGGYVWVTGEPWSFEFWAPGEPSNFANNEHFLEMFIAGDWNDQPNSGNGLVHGFYVEYEVPAYNPANGNYYDYVRTGAIDFDSAKAMAETMFYQGVQGHLATITSDEENDFISDTFDSKAWIGAYQDLTDPNYSEPDGGWKWVTGEPWGYDSWNTGEPNDGTGANEHYAEAWVGLWNDKQLSGSDNVGGFFVEYSNITIPGIFCTGDVSNPTGCPCNNHGTGEEGCANGSGLGGRLRATGSASVSSGLVTLSGSQLIASQPGLYFQGNNAINAGDGTLFGDGIRCAGGGVIRLQVRFASSAGESATNVDIAATGGVAAGDTKRYQLWYRDPLTSACGAQFNLTNGVEITFSS